MSNPYLDDLDAHQRALLESSGLTPEDYAKDPARFAGGLDFEAATDVTDAPEDLPGVEEPSAEPNEDLRAQAIRSLMAQKYPEPKRDTGIVSARGMGKAQQAFYSAGGGKSLPASFFAPEDTSGEAIKKAQFEFTRNKALADLATRRGVKQAVTPAVKTKALLQSAIKRDYAGWVESNPEAFSSASPDELKDVWQGLERARMNGGRLDQNDVTNTRRTEEARVKGEQFESRLRAQASRDASRATGRGLKDDAKTSAAEAKEKEKAGKFYLEGYDLSPDSRPTDVETRDLRKTQAQLQTIKEGVGEIRELYKRFGTEALPTEARARMSALARDLQLSLKGPEGYNLGVLSGPDLALLEEIAPSPTSGRANVLSFFGSDQTLPKLDELIKRSNSRFGARARSLGYTVRGSQGSGKVRVSNGRETLEIDAADVSSAESSGYRRMK